mmetsp:Transcript_5553/g.8492  ORF Transcript_5553/g.8492 Transcript_5553/m.8492 type:complete len:226 (+) Transcript_5553:341-1018(+)|eukprot:CAMPEP_0195289360 /NCGR_PEP_ID=MMETSP0707-20130614/5670_1 /TAXON_ID=33640 /ORGANISM="Asterionellopsis glacialis, Strain CCMP134" /LENGTH=225 /DNA_ID=CAMNT_0040349353 /DNA_START=152 /DNA_END=829 /DNA_ORIENTATION=-
MSEEQVVSTAMATDDPSSPPPVSAIHSHKAVKPALKKNPVHSRGDRNAGETSSPVASKSGSSGNVNTSATKKCKKGLKWDEKAIHEHDQLRGTRMKIDEPNTPYNYDSHSDLESDDNNNNRPKTPERERPPLNFDALQNKLHGVAAVRDQYPSSPSSHGDAASESEDAEDEKRRKLKHLEFEQHRKQHYNEFELMKRFRQTHHESEDDDDDDDDDGDAGDDEMET